MNFYAHISLLYYIHNSFFLFGLVTTKLWLFQIFVIFLWGVVRVLINTVYMKNVNYMLFDHVFNILYSLID